MKWPYRFRCDDITRGDLIHYLQESAREIAYATFVRQADLSALRAANYDGLYRISCRDNYGIAFYRSQLPSGMPVVFFVWSHFEHVFSEWPIFFEREYQELEDKQ